MSNDWSWQNVNVVVSGDSTVDLGLKRKKKLIECSQSINSFLLPQSHSQMAIVSKKQFIEAFCYDVVVRTKKGSGRIPFWNPVKRGVHNWELCQDAQNA